MFACLVPGFPPRQPSPYQTERKLDGRRDRTSTGSNEEKETREFYDTQLGQSIFHDSYMSHGPISQANGVPILPVQSGEKPLDNETLRFFEALLEFMVTQVRLHTTDFSIYYHCYLPSILSIISGCESRVARQARPTTQIISVSPGTIKSDIFASHLSRIR